MAYDKAFPADDSFLADFPSEQREQIRSVIQDAIVNAGTVKNLEIGNKNGNIPVANGNECINLNAAKVNGKTAADFAPKAHPHDVATESSDGYISNAMVKKVNGIAANAEVNQNAFSNIKVGSLTIQADNKTDVLEVVAGANIVVTPDTTNDKITIAVTGKVPSAAAADTATNQAGGTVRATTVTASTGKIESTGTTGNLPQMLFHIPSIVYSRLRMGTDGMIHVQDGGNETYRSIKAANFIGNASTANTSPLLSVNPLLAYGASGLNYFNTQGISGTAPNQNATPDGGWHHVLRMNHANNGGYFTDVAVPLDGYRNGMHWRQVVNGKSSNWFKICDSNNAASFTVGRATTATNAEKLNNQNWHWSGQGGQPTWLWGGSDGTNMYVYNPSNFRVNYANSAGSINWANIIGVPAAALGGIVGYSLAQNGWVKFQCGLILQWGTARTYSNNTYPIAFTNQAFKVIIGGNIDYQLIDKNKFKLGDPNVGASWKPQTREYVAFGN